MTREELLTTISEEFGKTGISAAEVADLYASSITFRRLLGSLWTTTQDGAKFLLGQNLISEEGRLQAIQQQGRQLGQIGLIESLLDLILEGDGNESAED